MPTQRRVPASAIVGKSAGALSLLRCAGSDEGSEMRQTHETARYTRRRRRRRKFGYCRGQFLNFRNELLNLHDFTSRFRNELLTPQRAISNAPNFTVRGQTIMAKQTAPREAAMAKQTAPREAAVSPSSGRFQVVCGGGTGRPGAVSDPVYTGRCVAVRANTARGCPQAPLTAEKPPSYSPAHRRPAHSHHPACTTQLRGSQRITRKRTSCPRDGPQPSSAAACEAGRAVLGLMPRSSR
jgi:hypothetical protein